jgi:hypothetical protein
MAAIGQPGAAMLDSKLFVSRLDGSFPDLYERLWDGDEWIWVDHGRPGGVKVTGVPGAEMMGEKLFVSVEDGRLFERHWRADLGSWAWEDHQRPANKRVVAGPGAAMMNSKLFVTVDDGRMFERHWRPDLARWAWEDHGRPPGTDVETAPGAAMMNQKLFVGARDGRLFERFWNGTQWVWVNHGTPMHDSSQYVIGAPGTGPKMSLAVIGDGFAEADLGEYRSIVNDRVTAALRLDQLGPNQGALRVARIDAVSPESGVTERRYDTKGTDTTADDTIASETTRFSRLGFIPTNEWSHCWIELSSFTERRVRKLRDRFAPDATRVIVVVNSGAQGGCNRGWLAMFTKRESVHLIAHELGHNMFDLDDEYVRGNLVFTGRSFRANTTERLTDWTTLKWSGLVTAGAALPTDPSALPAGWNKRTSVGAFEGAGGHYRTGLFRAVLECRMNQNNPPWCPVCGRKITTDLLRFLPP